jgi:hypothetical protein
MRMDLKNCFHPALQVSAGRQRQRCMRACVMAFPSVASHMHDGVPQCDQSHIWRGMRLPANPPNSLPTHPPPQMPPSSSAPARPVLMLMRAALTKRTSQISMTWILRMRTRATTWRRCLQRLSTMCTLSGRRAREMASCARAHMTF